MTAKWGLVKAHDHIVCVQQIHDSFVISAPLPSSQSTAVLQLWCRTFRLSSSPALPVPRIHLHICVCQNASVSSS